MSIPAGASTTCVPLAFRTPREERLAPAPRFTATSLTAVLKHYPFYSAQVLTFKEISWQMIRIEADAIQSVEHEMLSAPIRLITNMSKIRVTLKRRVSRTGTTVQTNFRLPHISCLSGCTIWKPTCYRLRTATWWPPSWFWSWTTCCGCWLTRSSKPWCSTPNLSARPWKNLHSRERAWPQRTRWT